MNGWSRPFAASGRRQPGKVRAAVSSVSAAIGLIGAASLASVAPAAAAEIQPPVQPLALVGAVDRPACGDTFAPFRVADLFARAGYAGGLIGGDQADPLQRELAAGASSADLQPSVVICSPTFADLPGSITGTTAADLGRTRVGPGWRELGAPVTTPGALVPGDRLTIPAVDDAAELRLSLATSTGRPTTQAVLRDLAPGPSTVSIARDARGLVASIVRADATTAEVAVQPLALPKGKTRLSGARKRWVIRTPTLPGTTVLHLVRGTTYFSSLRRGGARSTTVTSRLRTTFSVKSKRRQRVFRVEVNRPAHWVQVSRCVATLDRVRRPQKLECERLTAAELVKEAAEQYVLGEGDRSDTVDVVRALEQALKAPLTRASPPTGRGPLRAETATATPSARPRRGTADRAQAAIASPLTFRALPRSAALLALEPNDLRPLTADVNGDGQPDFWTEQTNDRRVQGRVAGILVTSGPTGLTPHRVTLPGARKQYFEDSELSAIADITGDGIGELVVDLGERAAIIPGTPSWTGTTAPIAASDPGARNPTGMSIVPPVSSPGSPLRTLDDVTGDGLPELVIGDDDGGWLSIPSSAVLRGRPTTVPTAARAVPPLGAVRQSIILDPGAPQADRAFRVIAGQAISVRWTVAATRAAPAGQLVVAIRDALGRDVRPPLTVPTPGDGILLDYDRLTGDLLLMAYGIDCTAPVEDRSGCVHTVMRVAPDGRVLQTVAATVDPTGDSDTFSPSSARFAPDGPDADAKAEVVMAASSTALAVAGSESVGALDSASLPQTTVVVAGRNRPWMLPRPVALFAPDGTRRLALSVATPQRDSDREDRGAELERTVPGELVWPGG